MATLPKDFDAYPVLPYWTNAGVRDRHVAATRTEHQRDASIRIALGLCHFQDLSGMSRT
jgi:hypothetical protein